MSEDKNSKIAKYIVNLFMLSKNHKHFFNNLNSIQRSQPKKYEVIAKYIFNELRKNERL